MDLRFHLILLAALPALLSACANTGVPDDDMARLLVAPDKFVLYRCPDIAEKAKEVAKRQRKLEALMAQASIDSGGRMVSAVAYRPEYLVARGEMNDLRQEAIAKKCDFVPGEGAAPGESEGQSVILPPPPANHPRAPAR
jgi:hypothetical protein